MWSGLVYGKRNEFIGFRSRTAEGGKASVVCLNPKASDYIPPHYFDGTLFNDIDPGAMAYLSPPDPEWVNPTDCNEFNCTGPLNAIFDFKNSMWAENMKYNEGADF